MQATGLRKAALFATILVSCGAVAACASGSGDRSTACSSTRVTYSTYAGVPSAVRKTPWVAASSAIVGHLFYWYSTPWGKAGQGHFHIYAGGRAPGNGVHMKILWRLRHGDAAKLVLKGSRVDGRSGSFKQTLPGHTEFPSIVNIPSSGCWRLHLSADHEQGTLVVVASKR